MKTRYHSVAKIMEGNAVILITANASKMKIDESLWKKILVHAKEKL